MEKKRKKTSKRTKKQGPIELLYGCLLESQLCLRRVAQITIVSTQMKDLPERASRGTRMHILEGAAREADMQFWNQDFFKEAEDDEDFSDSHGSFR